MKANEAKIDQIFERNVLLYVPFFQRSYVWGDDDRQRLLDDLISACKYKKSHFLGSIILKREWIKGENSIGWAHRCQVIDGQQRLTTLMILMRVVSIVNGKFKTFANVFWEIDDEIEELRLKHNIHDDEAFRYIMSLRELKDVPDELKGNIANAYEFFRERVTPEVAALLDVKRLSGLLDFVLIKVEEGENEQLIFDSINSLGVRLTTAELLKNHLFSEEDLGLYKKTWLPVFEQGNETTEFWAQEMTLGRLKKAAVDNFLYAYLQIVINDGSLQLDTAEKDEFQKYDKLCDSMKEMVRRRFGDDRTAVLDELIGYAKKYREIIDADLANKPAPSKPSVEKLLSIALNMDVSTVIPYVLYVLYNAEDEEERNKIFGMLEGYIMRRFVAQESNKNYNRFFTERLIGNKALTAEGLKKILLESNESYPTDDTLRDGFATSQFKQHKQARGILYYIESSVRNEDLQSSTLLPFASYSLEHMLPQTWKGTVWDDGGDEDKKNVAMRSIGNMTIVTKSLNSTMRNSDWQTKVDVDGEKGLFHNASGLVTMSGIFALPEWNEEQIAIRGEKLFNLAKKVWPGLE